MNFKQRILGTTAPSAAALVRVVTGWVFLSEGIQKFLFPEALGIGRFMKIGIPAAEVMAPFVGFVEIIAGGLLIAGLLTRISALALVIDILVALATTKIPMLVQKGFWTAAHESRTDLAMAFSLAFFLWVGGGTWSADAKLAK